ncbi:10820_t:CDS:2 [Funneliformis caledonium]|uniref:10820_t:CDS:1 n=1 Tax=Funneliformis caledonium TaxID=1117310 RepID=A0A9N8ZCS8_9GLOM|nr:10820_t:CDS:2 [Funneliformis caledonium]
MKDIKDIKTLNDILVNDGNYESTLSSRSSSSSSNTYIPTSNHSSTSTSNPISIPQEEETIKISTEYERDIIELHILKLHDPSIIDMLEKQLCKVNGIENVEIDFATGNAIINYNKKFLGTRDIQDVISEWKRSFYYSLTFTIPILVISMILPKFEWGLSIINLELFHGLFVGDLVSFLSCLIVQFGIGKKFYIATFKEIRDGNFTKNLLIVIATSIAFFFSCYSMIDSIFNDLSSTRPLIMFDTSATLITCVALGNYLENVAKRNSLEYVTGLLSRIPKSTTILHFNGEITGEKIIPTEYLQVGDVAKISPGMIIPADGKVISGLSDVNESMILGKPPGQTVRKVRRGDDVIGGCVNGSGNFEMQVVRVGNDSILSQIIKFVKDSQVTNRSPIPTYAYKCFILGIITLGIMLFTLWVFTNLEMYLNLSISILILPCLSLISIDVRVGSDIGARNGILIKGKRAFTQGTKITKVIFNKTGTLTQGKFDLAHYELMNEGLKEITPEIFFTLIGAVESLSEHPIGKCIADYSKQLLKGECDDDVDVSNFEYITERGTGIKCDVLLNTFSYLSFYNTSRSYKVLIGNIEFISKLHRIEIPKSALLIKENQELLGRTIVLVAINNTFIGLLSLSDLINPETKLTVGALKFMGIKVAMITADERLTTQTIASQCGIDEIYFQLSSKDKINVTRSLQLTDNIAMWKFNRCSCFFGLVKKSI